MNNSILVTVLDAFGEKQTIILLENETSLTNFLINYDKKNWKVVNITHMLGEVETNINKFMKKEKNLEIGEN